MDHWACDFESLEDSGDLFDAHQMQLAFAVLPINDGRADEDSSVDLWDTPHRVLKNFLTSIGTPHAAFAARALLHEFGTLADVMATSRSRLRPIAGWRAANAIRASRDISKTILLKHLNERPLLPLKGPLIDFLQVELGYLHHERMLAIYADGGNRLIQIERIGDGTISQVLANIPKIIGVGLRLGASGILLVHNHPSGLPKPSHADLAMTRRLRDIAEQLDMRLLDHLIIARGEAKSINDHYQEARWRGEVE